MDKIAYGTPNVQVWIYNAHTSLGITGTSAEHCTENMCFSRK